jgi:endonuclease/exonuclease/phosphatase (EEP) superfamily protein YafD
MIGLLELATLFLVVTAALPLLSTGKWYVRGWDFPRLQLTIITAAACVVLGWQWHSNEASGLGQWSTERLVLLVCLLVVFVWHASHVIKFSWLWPKEVPDIPENIAAQTIKIAVVNHDYENSSFGAAIEEILSIDADILLLVETDHRWWQAMGVVAEAYPFQHKTLRGEGLGMVLLSRLPIRDAEARELVSLRRPSVWATIELTHGQHVNFVGVHPTPPGLLDRTGESRRDSRVRDAELIIIAKEIANRCDESWIVAGDFNDVAWSHTTRLFKRISGLRDPRVGRSFMGTFLASNPLLRVPIDHVFLSDGFTVQELSRCRITGSDHFAISASVAFERVEGTQPRPEGNDKQEATMLIDEGRNHADERGLLSSEVD